VNPPRKLLWALVWLGFLAALALLHFRWQREAAWTGAEPVLDYRAVADLARRQGVDTQALLQEYQSYGIRSLAVDETTAEDLLERGLARTASGLELLGMAGARLATSPTPDPERMYLLFTHLEESGYRGLAEVQQALETALGAGRVRLFGPGILEVATDRRTLETIGLGFSRQELERLRALGFRLWLRPENVEGGESRQVARKVEMLASLGPFEGLIFSGFRNEALGFPDALDLTAALLESRGWKLGLIELPDKAQQKGIEALARRLSSQVVRVLALAPGQQARLDPEAVVDTYSLGARERNIRVLYLRPYTEAWPGKTLAQTNQALFAGLAREIPPAPAGTLGRLETRPWRALAASLVAGGAAAATWLLALYVLPVPPAVGWGLMALLAGLTLVTGLAGPGPLWRTLLALGTACVVPALGMVAHFDRLEEAGRQARRRRVLREASLVLLAVTGITTAGGLMAASLLWEASFMLGIDVFRGVKVLSLGLPLVVLALWCHLREGGLGRVLDLPVRLWQVLGLLALGALAALYLARTGNVSADFGGGAVDAEKVLRRLLDQALGVRPRFKEFLLGHPALLLIPALWRVGWRRAVWLALLAAAVGQASVADTYAHIHTPLRVSLVRTLLGLGLGWALGLALAGVVLRLGLRPGPAAAPAAGPPRPRAEPVGVEG
jgi:hypothetical protein